MSELDILIATDPIRVIPVSVSFVDQLLVNGPCRLHGFSFRDSSGDLPLENQSNITSPGALAAIVTISGLVAGTYNVNWQVGLAGTLAAGDANNFVLQQSGVTVMQAQNGFAPGEYPQESFEITVTSGQNLIIKSIAAGTVGAVYSGQITLIPIALGNTLAELQDGNNPLMEITVPTPGADTRWFGDSGLWVRNRINLHPIAGAVTGAVFVRYSKSTG